MYQRALASLWLRVSRCTLHHLSYIYIYIYIYIYTCVYVFACAHFLAQAD